jgi:hypothetical protein
VKEEFSFYVGVDWGVEFHQACILDAKGEKICQPRWGDDARFSVRGSGLFRNYGKGDVAMYLESIPINTSDGYVDLFEMES